MAGQTCFLDGILGTDLSTSDGVLVMPDQNCYFNSYESVYMIMIMGTMTVQAAQPRAPT